MRFSLSRHLREVGRGRARSNAPSRRARTWAGGFSLEDLEERKLLSAAGVAVSEGNVNQANFHIHLPFAPAAPFSASAKTFDESAKSGTEYTAVSTAVTFQPGTKEQTVTVPVTADKDYERSERFVLQVSVPARNRFGVATVLNSFPNLPHVLASNPTILEVGPGPFQANFVVSLSRSPATPLAFTFMTHDESAKAGTDYTSTSGSLTFTPGGPTSMVVPVPVATEPGYHFPKRFVLEVVGAYRTAFGVATIKWIHPRNPIPTVSNPTVIETASS